VKARHGIGSGLNNEVIEYGSASATPEMERSRSEHFDSPGTTQNRDKHIVENIPILRGKLEELEKERKELASAMKELSSRQSLVDGDIQTLKRTMQLVAK
jgi:hypothetical protein